MISVPFRNWEKHCQPKSTKWYGLESFVLLNILWGARKKDGIFVQKISNRMNGTNGVVKWISRQQLERLFTCQQCERFMFKIKFVDSHPFGVLNFWHHAKRKYNCFKKIANIVFCPLYNKYRTHNRIKWCTKRVETYTLTIRNL